MREAQAQCPHPPHAEEGEEGHRAVGTTAHGGRGSKGRAANGDRPTGTASCRREQYTHGDMPTPPPPARMPLLQSGQDTQPMEWHPPRVHPPPPLEDQPMTDCGIRG